MLRAHRGPVQLQQAATLEDAIDDGGGEVIVVQDFAPRVDVKTIERWA